MKRSIYLNAPNATDFSAAASFGTGIRIEQQRRVKELFAKMLESFAGNWCEAYFQMARNLFDSKNRN